MFITTQPMLMKHAPDWTLPFMWLDAPPKYRRLNNQYGRQEY